MILSPMFLVACGAMAPEEEQKAGAAEDRFAEVAMEPAPAPEGARAKKDEGRVGRAQEEMESALSAMGYAARDDDKAVDGLMGEKGAPGGDGQPPAPTRAWFPETMLWAPAVLTDDAGAATVDVVVPDSLTSWRVLALGAGQNGAQAGATHSFRSSLPVQVDLRLPEKLRAGDRVRLPIRMINTTTESQSGQLRVEAMGLDGGGGAEVSLAPRSSRVEVVTLTATRPGSGSVTATLEGQDAVLRQVSVVPTGQPMIQSAAGILGTADAVGLTSPAGSDAAKLKVTLFPGPLGVFKSELGRPARADVHGAAYAQLLANRAPDVLTTLGAAPDEDTLDALRALRLKSQQKLVGPSMNVDHPTDVALLLLSVQGSDDPIAEGMSSRMRTRLSEAQAGDGTWTLHNGATLQELLAVTAWCAAALDDPGASVRARGAFERYSQYLLDAEQPDPYTAALVLRAGVDSDSLREGLLQIVRDWDGEVPVDVKRPDGAAVTELDVMAAAATVLPEDERRDAVSAVIASYRPGAGFGAPVTGVLALEAITSLDSGAPPDALDIVVQIDGQEVGRQTLRREALGQVVTFSVDAPTTGEHSYAVVSDGAWPGLAWHLDLTTWSPWEGGVGPKGLELHVEHDELVVGQATTVTLRASAPKGTPIVIEHRPPAGFVVDRDSVTGGQVHVDDETVEVRVSAHEGLATVTYEAVPTLAGTLHTGVASVYPMRAEDLATRQPPEAWVVR